MTHTERAIAQALNQTMPMPLNTEHVWYATVENVMDAISAHDRQFDAKGFLAVAMQDAITVPVGTA